MTVGLERQLWRYEYGRLGAETLQAEIRAALDALGDRAGMLPYLPAVAVWNPRLTNEFDAALALARSELDCRRFRQALQQQRKAEQTFTKIIELLDADAAIERAGEAANELYELAGASRLRGLPTVASLAQLLDTARSWVGEGQSREAMHVARLCVHMAAVLTKHQAATDAESERFREELATLAQLSSATVAFTTAEDDLAIDGTLVSLQTMFERGCLRLASRLLAEVQMQLAGRERFRVHYERARYDGTEAATPIEEVRERVRVLSWDGAVEYEWHASMQHHVDALQQQLQRLNDIPEESWRI